MHVHILNTRLPPPPSHHHHRCSVGCIYLRSILLFFFVCFVFLLFLPSSPHAPPTPPNPTLSCCCSSPLGLHPSGCRGLLAADSQPPYFTASQPSSWQHSHRQEIALAVSGISNTGTLRRLGRPSTASLSLSLVSLLPISLHTSLCLSLSLSVFLSFSPSLCSSLYTYSLLFSLFPPPSLCFSVFPPLPDCLSTHSHIRTAMRIVFLICLLFIFAVPFSFWVFLPPSFPSSTPHSLHTLFSPFPSFHSSIPPPLYDPQGNKVW